MSKTQKNYAINISLALLAPIIFFGLCETILFLTGLKPLALTEDPYIGFSASQPLFIEEAGSAGQTLMVTNPVKLTHFNKQSFPKEKKPGTFRIFSVGGSTAYGHPWRDPVSFSGWLRLLLPKFDSSKKWEVINAGGISYASYREANLIAELSQYKPDLFLVYSGHNEFLEERTYRKTVNIPQWIRNLSATLDHTRTFSGLKLLMRKIKPASTEEKANGNSKENKNGDIIGDKPKLEGEVNDILANTIGPTSYTRNDTLKQQVLEHYQNSLERMAEIAHSVGAEIIFLTTPGNEKDCSPFKSEATEGISDIDKQKVIALMNKPAPTFEDIDSAVQLDPRNASLLYRAGKAAEAAGKFPEAKKYLNLSLDEDICPLRALSAMHEIVLTTAEKTETQAIDIKKLMEEKTAQKNGNNLLGEPDFVDHVHLSIDNYRWIALQIIDRMKSLGWIKNSPATLEADLKQATDSLMATMGPREMGEGLHNLAKVINWAGKHEDAARIAERALAIDSMGLEAIWSSLFVGAAREREAKEEEAIRYYRHAISLDSNFPLSHYYLAAALSRANLDQEALHEFKEVLELEPENTEAREEMQKVQMRMAEANQKNNTNQGMQDSKDKELQISQNNSASPKHAEAIALFQKGQKAKAKGNIPEAINFYAKALTLDPNYAEASAALSQILGAFGNKP